MPYSIRVLEALSDNHMYLIIDAATKQAAAVDPVDARECVQAAAAEGVTIVMALTTHHHYDHAGGNKELKKLLPRVEIIGGDPVEACTRQVRDAEVLRLGECEVRCVHTPSHTAGHMSYLVSGGGEQPGAVFTGDSMFIGGCGRLFEGGPDQMLAALQKLGSLPPSTLLYDGHEYTVKNLQFSLEVEPENLDAQRKIVWAQEQRKKGLSTCPSTIGEQHLYNPFLRTAQPTVKAHVGGGADEVAVMRKLRNAKDKFAGSSRPWIPGGGPLPGL
mmetsp:Transcript_14631/g.24373  ORF Transcript_14631/g.24373 Transcript_14631/m.24373 type:complete len:273 (-) Transcript_14631:409-1227(-)